MPYDSYVPRGSAPTYDATAGGHPLIPEDVQADIVKGITQKSASMQLFKHRRMTRAQSRIPVLDTKPTAYFVTGDTGLKQTSSTLWRNVFLNAEELAVILPIPEKLLDDIDYDMWGEVRPEVEEAFAVALDAAIFFGTNKPSSWPTAIGPAAIAAGNTVTQGAGVDVAADINNVMAAAEADGYDVNGFVMQNSLKATLRGLRDSQNGFIFLPNVPGAENTAWRGTLFGEKAVTLKSGIFEAEDTASANHVKLFAGDWQQGILGIRQDIDMKMLDQAAIFDNTGALIFNLPQQDMVAARFTARFAFAVPNPINRMNATLATRYPFSVLRNTT